jgi:hypothetical protein
MWISNTEKQGKRDDLCRIHRLGPGLIVVAGKKTKTKVRNGGKAEAEMKSFVRRCAAPIMLKRLP